MRNLKSKPFLVLAFSVIAIVMSGCGKSKNDAANNGGGTYYPQNCQPGVPCQPGGGGAVAPLGAPMQFSGTMYIDSANIYFGTQLPTSQMQTNMMPAQATYQGQSPYGTMVIQTMQQVGPNLYNVTGAVTLSQAYVQQIMSSTGGYGCMTGTYGCMQPQVALTARVVAINVGHYNLSLYGGGFGGSNAARILLSTGQEIPFFL
jgi:hypothetical protein